MSARVHKKSDGYLLIHADGSARYMTFAEVLVYRVRQIWSKT